jgi:hypothetical protein
MPRVRVKDGEREEVREILGQVLTFGRAPDSHIVLSDRECSRHHCYIERVERGFKLVDLESRNGTKANGQFRNQHLLRTNDVITIGKAEIVFIDENDPGPSGRVTGGVSAPAPVGRAMAAASAPVERVTAPVARKDPGPAVPAARAESGGSPTLTARRMDRQERMLRAHQEKERKTLTLVFVIAGLFILLLVGAFVYLSGAGTKSEAEYVKGLFDSAEKAVRSAAAAEDPDLRAGYYEEAIRQLTLVPETAEQPYGVSRKRIEELGLALKQAKQDALSSRIRREMGEIDQYIKGRQPPDTFGALNRFERLLQTVPVDHPLRAEILKQMEQVKAMRGESAPQ